MGDADGDGGIVGETLTGELDGVDATWPVAPGLPHAQAIDRTAIAVLNRTRSMYHERVAGGFRYPAATPRLGRLKSHLGVRAES